jgi:hypothetical protein
MKIYYGTSHSIARRASSRGLPPSNLQVLPLNLNIEWVISSPDMVYLSTTCALMGAVESNETKIAVLEIETDKLDEINLYPDEDFIYEILKRRNPYFQTEKDGKLHRYIRDNPSMFKGYWEESLQMLGNICHKGLVPPTAITRYAIFDLSKNSKILTDSMNPETCCITNHAVIGQFYKQFIAWLFDEVRELPHIKERMDILSNIKDKKSDMAIHLREQIELFKMLQKKRDGIKIVNL